MSEEKHEAAPNAPEADNLPENKINVEDAGTLKKKVSITVSRARIEAKQNEMFGELAHTALVPGFRIGHAPRRLIEKRFGKEITQDVRNSLVGESVGAAIEKSGLKTLGDAEIDLDKIVLPDAGDLEFSFNVEVMPEFELPKTKEIEVRKTKLEANDKLLEDYLDQLRRGRAHYEETADAAQEGDTVLAGAKLEVEGSEPLDRPGLTLRVAPGQVEGLPLVDLGKALAGKKAGDSAETSITVPEGHPNEAWRGKKAVVSINISQVRRQHLPEVNEEFAKSLGFQTLDEMKDYLLLRLKQRLEAESRRSQRDQICQFLVDNTKFDLPEGVVGRHTARLLQRRYVQLIQMGVPQEKIEENLTKLHAEAGEQAKRDLKLSFILGKIAEAEGVQVSELDVNARIAEMAREYNRRPERMRQDLAADGSLEQVAVMLLEEKTLDRLLEQAQVVEVDAEEAAKEKSDEKPAKERKSHKPKAEKAEETSTESEKPARKSKAKSEDAPTKKAKKDKDSK